MQKYDYKREALFVGGFRKASLGLDVPPVRIKLLETFPGAMLVDIYLPLNLPQHIYDVFAAHSQRPQGLGAVLLQELFNLRLLDDTGLASILSRSHLETSASCEPPNPIGKTPLSLGKGLRLSHLASVTLYSGNVARQIRASNSLDLATVISALRRVASDTMNEAAYSNTAISKKSLTNSLPSPKPLPSPNSIRNSSPNSIPDADSIFHQPYQRSAHERAWLQRKRALEQDLERQVDNPHVYYKYCLMKLSENAK